MSTPIMVWRTAVHSSSLGWFLWGNLRFKLCESDRSQWASTVQMICNTMFIEFYSNCIDVFFKFTCYNGGPRSARRSWASKRSTDSYRLCSFSNSPLLCSLNMRLDSRASTRWSSFEPEHRLAFSPEEAAILLNNKQNKTRSNNQV